MSKFRRVFLVLIATMALLMSLSSAALAAGGSGGGGGGGGTGGGSSTGGGGVDNTGGSGGGGSSAAPCGAVAMNAPTFTTYYQYFTGTVTNCEATTLDYVVTLNDISNHTDPLCTLPSTSNKKLPLAPGTINVSWFKPLPCYGDYTIQAELTLNRRVAGTSTISFTYTPTGIIMH